MSKSTTSAPAPAASSEVEVEGPTDAQLDAIVTEGELELEDAGTGGEVTTFTDPQGEESPEETPEPEVDPIAAIMDDEDLSPVQKRNALRALLVTAQHDAGIKGLEVLQNREKEQALHAHAVLLREAGKTAREAHKVAREQVQKIRTALKD